MHFRPKRVGKLIMEELNKLILLHVETLGVLVTITSVEVSKDLNYALVKISAIPQEKAKETLKKLTLSQNKLQHLLLRKINIKPMPQIRFELDYGPEQASRVEKALLENKL